METEDKRDVKRILPPGYEVRQHGIQWHIYKNGKSTGTYTFNPNNARQLIMTSEASSSVSCTASDDVTQQAIELKRCPKCSVTANGHDEIQAVFGFRQMNGRRCPQSWCRDCRSEGITHSVPKTSAELILPNEEATPCSETPLGPLTAEPQQVPPKDIRQLKDIFDSEFPLLEELRVATEDAGALCDLPHFLGYLLAAARKEESSPCCFIVPCATQVAHLVATLFVLDSVKRNLPGLRTTFATTGLSIGETVKVLPTGAVFEYRGIYPDNPNFFRLAVLETEGRDNRSIPIDEILRLEPTERKRPKGSLTGALGTVVPSGLSELLGVEFYGNQGLFENVMVLLSTQIEMRAFADQFWAKSPIYDHRVKVWKHIPWGAFTDSGDLVHEDRYLTRGQPCLAVSANALNVTEFCRKSKARRKLVIADKLEYFKHNLQAFDELAEQQHLVIISTPSDQDLLAELSSRGLKVWRLSPTEIFLTEDGSIPPTPNALFAEIYRRTAIASAVTVDEIRMQHSPLDQIAYDLETARSALESDDTLEEFFGKMWASLLSAASVACRPDAEWSALKLENIQACAVDLRAMSQWIPNDVVERLSSSCELLQQFFQSCVSQPPEKYSQLVSHVAANRDGHLMVLLPTAELVPATKSQLPAQSNFTVGAVADVWSNYKHQGETEFIVVGWPYRSRWQRLLSLNLVRRVTLLSYGFESSWLASNLRLEHRRRAEQMPSKDTKANICGVPTELL